MSLYMEFVGSRQVQRRRRPWMTGIGDDRNAIDEKASGVMSWLDFSSTLGSSAYRREPITIIVQKRSGHKS
jgi:hypothetical protein